MMIALAAGMALSQGAKVGGEARQLAMGAGTSSLGVAVNPFITQDPVFILINPAYQSYYGSYVWWNIGGGGLVNSNFVEDGYGKQNVGVSFNLSRDLVIGGIFSYDPSAVNVVSGLLKGGTALTGLPFAFPAFIPAGLRAPAIGTEAAINGGQTIPGVANVWEVLAAYKTGTLDFGFGVTYGRSNSDATISNPGTSYSREASSSMFGVRAGILMDFGGGSNFDGHAAIRFDKATDNVKFNPVVATQGGEYSVSGTEIEVGARLKLRVSNRFNFVPYGSFTSVSATPKEDAPRNTIAAIKTTETSTTTALAFGAGGEYKLSTFYLAGGLSFQMLRAKVEVTDPAVGAAPASSSTTTNSFTSVPTINLGAEWWLTDWLAARGGYYRAIGNVNSKLETSAGNAGSSGETNLTFPESFILLGGLNPATWDGVVTLGLGLRFGNFSLDGTISDEALRRGLGLLGSADNINTFGYLTASYNFE
jgi:hypothetical protein